MILNILGGILAGVKDSLVGITSIRKVHIQNEKISKRLQQRHQQRLQMQLQQQQQSGNNQNALARYNTQMSLSSSKHQTFNVYQKLLECCAFNIGVFGSSIVIFDWILLPYMHELMRFIFDHESRVARIWSWLNPMLLYTFGAFWVLPLFILSRFVNAFWFQDIAECTFNMGARSKSSRSVSFFIADTLFSLIIQALFLIQAVMLGKLLYIGQIASIFHLSLLYSLYSFEYKWFYYGWELHRRLNFIESNWPYFFGFGLPLALLTSIPQSYLLSGSIFSTLFPIFIISSNEAKPNRIFRNDYAIEIFAPVVFLSNRIFQMTIYLNATRFRRAKQQ